MTALEELHELRRQKERREPAELSPKSPTTSGVPLAQFAGSGRVVAIYSDVLGEEAVFAADNARLPEGETRPVYRARELVVIWGEDGSISAEGLRLLHEVKTRFGAEIEAEEGGHCLT